MSTFTAILQTRAGLLSVELVSSNLVKFFLSVVGESKDR